MKLKELIAGIYAGPVDELYLDLNIKSICCDSRLANESDIFVALQGCDHHGNDFIYEAVNKGVKVVVCDQIAKVGGLADEICVLHTDNPKMFLRKIATKFYDFPARKLKTVGITGTNGKTTVARLKPVLLESENTTAASFSLGLQD